MSRIQELRERIARLNDELAAAEEEAERLSANCPHLRLVETQECELFHSRKGCADCNQWFGPVRLKRR